MISKVERGDAQPTAVLLAKLSGALGMTLSELIARAEGDSSRLRRTAQQATWVDPDTGYERRAVSPASSAAVELVDVVLPPRAEVSYPAEAYQFIDQQIWMLDGQLRFVEGEQTHELEVGDCLHLGNPVDCKFMNPGDAECRYLVVLGKNAAPRRAVSPQNGSR